MINIRQFLGWIACIGVLLVSCEQERDPCLQPTNAYVRLGCYRPADTGTGLIDTLLPNVILAADSEGVLKALYYGAKDISKMSILLSSIADSCTYIIQPDSGISVIDTLQFYYDRELQFLSNACGYSYFFTIRKVNTTHHNIDSVRINNGDVNLNANAAENVQVFF